MDKINNILHIANLYLQIYCHWQQFSVNQFTCFFKWVPLWKVWGQQAM